jgi:hypothetical protein
MLDADYLKDRPKDHIPIQSACGRPGHRFQPTTGSRGHLPCPGQPSPCSCWPHWPPRPATPCRPRRARVRPSTRPATFVTTRRWILPWGRRCGPCSGAIATQASTEEDFVERIIAFVKAPSLEQALITPAVERLGLMPALPLPDEMLRKIAAYIWEADFAPPCEHWRNAARWAESAGDADHAAHDARMLQRFCSGQP